VEVEYRPYNTHHQCPAIPESLPLFVKHPSTNCRQISMWWICIAVSRRLDTRHALFFTELNLCISTWMCVWCWFIAFMVKSVCGWIYVSFGQMCALTSLHFCCKFWMNVRFSITLNECLHWMEMCAILWCIEGETKNYNQSKITNIFVHNVLQISKIILEGAALAFQQINS
jgi:hypothetical protein